MRIASPRQRTLSFYQSLPSYTQEWHMIARILEANPEIKRQAWEMRLAAGHTNEFERYLPPAERVIGQSRRRAAGKRPLQGECRRPTG
jgi:hypothetical protein